MAKSYTDNDESSDLQPQTQDEGNAQLERTRTGCGLDQSWIERKWAAHQAWAVTERPDGNRAPWLTPAALAALAQERGEHVSHHNSRS